MCNNDDAWNGCPMIMCGRQQVMMMHKREQVMMIHERW